MRTKEPTERSRMAAGTAVIRSFLMACLIPAFAHSGSDGGDEGPSPATGAWQNPNLGAVADVVADAHDAAAAGSWRSEGLRVRAMELEISSNIDPYASLTANLFVAREGAELHELFVFFPYLPGGVKLKAGQMLANFGRWSRFHGHFMPFASEPRLLREYAGGGLLQTGAELSWMLPLHHFAEITLGVYNGISGHSHDPDPAGARSADPLSPAGIADEEGCVSHGNHWDCPDGIFYEDDLLALRGLDGREPLTRLSNREASDLAFGARANTTLEFGLDWSLDLGSSAMFQPAYKHSRRLDLAYPKALLGLDATFFWHPLSRNLYRGLDFGIEALANYEGFEESVSPTKTRELYRLRRGAFGYARWRHDARWHFGAFAEAFQPRQGRDFLKKRGGVFATFHITHYQYLRFEASRYEHDPSLDPVHRFLLQYDAVIGYHTHGVQR